MEPLKNDYIKQMIILTHDYIKRLFNLPLTGIADANVDLSELRMSFDPVEHFVDVLRFVKITLDSVELSSGTSCFGLF